jgi:hypothetical protein
MNKLAHSFRNAVEGLTFVARHAEIKGVYRRKYRLSLKLNTPKAYFKLTRFQYVQLVD